MSRQAYPVDDDTLLQAIREALDDGEHYAAGGVAARHVAQYCPLAEPTLETRLPQLADAGHLRRVWGITDAGPRKTYLPIDREAPDRAE